MNRRLLLCLLAALPAHGLAVADTERVEALVIDATNDFRRDEGLDGLKGDALLERAARDFAAYMARTDKYGHTADGREPAARVKAQGYNYCLVSENISYQFNSAGFPTIELAARYFQGWKKSPGHRRNMLDPHVMHTAVSVARSARTGRYYAVQLFGRPRSAAIEFRISNLTRESVRYRINEEAYTLGGGIARVHTECKHTEVSLQGGEAVTPGHGDRLAVARRSGRLALYPER